MVSFPYSGTPPSCTVLRPFHIPATDPDTKVPRPHEILPHDSSIPFQAVVFLLWLHLWMAPLTSALCGCLLRAASVGPSASRPLPFRRVLTLTLTLSLV